MNLMLPPKIFSVNRSHPQAKGLKLWFVPNRALSPTLFDLASHNIATFSSVGHNKTKVLGNTIAFSGTPGTEHVQVTYNPTLNISNPMTLAAWVIPSFTNGTGVNEHAKILCRRATSINDPWQVWAIGTNNASPAKFVFVVSTDVAGSGTPVLSVKNTLLANKVFHVCGTYDGVTMRLYINGVADGTTSTGITVGANSQQICLGTVKSANSANNHWAGDIGDARVYNRALSAGEVYDLYAPATRWGLYKSVNAIRMPSLASDPGRLVVAQAGAYAEFEKEAILVAEAGAYVEFEKEAVSVAQVGAYIEYQDVALDTFGPRIQVI